MTVQLSLPAGWARNFVSMPDPRDRLDALLREKDDAKAEIRLVLDRLADKHDIPSREVDLAMLAVDDSIGDIVYDIEQGLHHEIEGEEPY